MLSAVILILLIWIAVYLFITKSTEIKRRVKLYLRKTFNDVEERLWSVLVSLWYDFFPFFTLAFVPLEVWPKLFPVTAYNFAYLILYGILGYFASLTISSVALDGAHFAWQLSYEEMSGVTWMSQTQKISNFFGVLAAVTEEFFLRYLVPFLLYWQSGSEQTFLGALIVSSLIFGALQMAYVTSKLQCFVMFVASFSISLVSILLLLATKHILPSLIMHAAYVFFFLSKTPQTQPG